MIKRQKQVPVFSTVQSALYFTSLTDLFTQTPSRLLWEAYIHMREGYSYTYPPLYIARYSFIRTFIQLSELEQCRVKKLARGFNTTAQDSNPGSLSRESKALPLSHCALDIIKLHKLIPKNYVLTICNILLFHGDGKLVFSNSKVLSY